MSTYRIHQNGVPLRQSHRARKKSSVRYIRMGLLPRNKEPSSQTILLRFHPLRYLSEQLVLLLRGLERVVF